MHYVDKNAGLQTYSIFGTEVNLEQCVISSRIHIERRGKIESNFKASFQARIYQDRNAAT